MARTLYSIGHTCGADASGFRHAIMLSNNIIFQLLLKQTTITNALDINSILFSQIKKFRIFASFSKSKNFFSL